MEVTMLNGYNLNGDQCKPAKPTIELLRQYVDTRYIERMGLVPTEKFLKNNSIPYATALNEENNSGSFSVSTPCGIVNLPTVMTRQQADEFLKRYNNPTCPIETMPCQQEEEHESKYPWWLWLGAGVAGYLLLRKNPESAKPVNGFSGLPKTKTKVKVKKAKFKTIHV